MSTQYVVQGNQKDKNKHRQLKGRVSMTKQNVKLTTWADAYVFNVIFANNRIFCKSINPVEGMVVAPSMTKIKPILYSGSTMYWTQVES